ncbi:MAG: LysM peptidoglycan-binding domain-containing protein [Victivallales bacterium]|nr:LysM peptidoglycan-binding domain-containing protein [Victivallales bacterium]
MHVKLFWLLALTLAVGACRGMIQPSPASSSASSNINNVLRSHDERISELAFSIKHLAESNNQLVRKCSELSAENAVLKRQSAEMENSMAVLQGALNAEKAARQAEMEKLTQEVARQISSAVSTVSVQSQQPSQTQEGKPAMKGSFYEYTVQPGATLGAIARAYKVSVEDIKKVNNLKGDVIFIGQKLYIPKN